MKIGNIVVEEPVVGLSPMAGISSVTFRALCKEQGCSYAPTELVSARSIVYNGIDKSYRFMETDRDLEGVTCIQLFGNDPDDFAEAVKIICSDPRTADTDIIDINMGCPVPKVVKTGAGSALMRTPDIARNIVTNTVKAAAQYGKPVTVKTRVGWDQDDDTGAEFAEMLADSGAAAVCVHGRTREQMYHGMSSVELIAGSCEKVKPYGIPFLANGDVKDGASAADLIEKTGADGVMIGRAARGNPWIFRQVREYLKSGELIDLPSEEERYKMLIRELRGTADRIGEVTAVKEMRSVMPHYIKGMRGAAYMKVRLCQASTIEEVEQIIREGAGI